jgi:ubiquinone/menaquinone biosynthesis C-methylase UbiE
MKKSELGMPIGYDTLAEYYNALSQDDADSKNRVIEEILKKHKVETVLDLTCGTGAQVFWLEKHGYKVTGVDFNPALLEIAKEKALRERLGVTLIEGDMRTTKAGNFDAVITIFNAVGHLTKADFEKTMTNIYKNLKDDGLYVFDILNLEAMTDSTVNKPTIDLRKTVNDTEIHHIRHAKLDRNSGQLALYDQFSIQKGFSKPEILKGKFTLQIYTAEELRVMLARNGFETLAQYGIDGSKFIEEKTKNILTVVKKR